MKNAPDRKAIEGAPEQGDSITVVLPPFSLGWRAELAEGVPSFRRNGRFADPTNSRCLRRALERAERKATKKANRGAIRTQVIALLAVACWLVAAIATVAEVLR